ncbi:MAG: FAD:protein FMN transferase [Halieaceae bacterium]|nr:FAD:protein FMN transferase [Halieaceae bacterium]
MGGPARLLLTAPRPLSSEDLITEVLAMLEALEARYSRYRPDSLVSRINAAAGTGEAIAIDPETAALFRFIDTLHRESNALFDPTTGPLSRAWDFRNARAPGNDELAELRGRVGWRRVEWSDAEALLPVEGMELDLGGVVKEYAADAVVALLRRAGVEHALVELAGDVATLGRAPGGAPWRVAIRHPDAQAKPLGELSLSASAVATSGDYARSAVVDGKRLSHCIDPRTGTPVHGPISVSVAAAQCLLAGATATVAMLQPPAEATRWLETVGLPWMMLDRDRKLSGPLCEESLWR